MFNRSATLKHVLAASALIASTSFSSPLFAYPTRVETTEIYQTDDDNTYDCSSSWHDYGLDCARITAEELPAISGDGLMVQLEFTPTVYWNKGAKIWSFIVKATTLSGLSVGDVVAVGIYYRRDTNRFTIRRQIVTDVDEDGNVSTKTIDYEILDSLFTEKGEDSGWHDCYDDIHTVMISKCHYMTVRVYFTSDFMWLEVYDRSEPVFGPVGSEPLYFGIGDFLWDQLTISDTADAEILMTTGELSSGDEDGCLEPYQFHWDTCFPTVSTFDSDDLISDVNANYSSPPTAPFREMHRVAPAIISIFP